MWFIYARPTGTRPPSHRPALGKVAASAMIIAVSNGRSAVVTAAPSLGGRFRFLAGFHGGGQPYTLSEGAPGLTLAGLPAGTRCGQDPGRTRPG